MSFLIGGIMSVTFLTGYLTCWTANHLLDTDNEDAMKLYELTLWLNPYIADPYMGQATHRFLNSRSPDRVDAALRVLDRGIGKFPSSDMYELRARIYGFKKHDLRAAVKDLDSAIKWERARDCNNKQLMEFYRLRSQMHILAGEKTKAEEDLKNYADCRNKYFSSELERAATHEKQEQYEAVIGDLKSLRAFGDEDALLKAAEINSRYLRRMDLVAGDYSSFLHGINPDLRQTPFYKSRIEKYEELLQQIEPSQGTK
jgi:hypothetical protein